MSADATVTTPPALLPFGGGRPLPPSGTTLADRFCIESLAGRGGMGSVYRATDLHTRRPVALKLLHAVTSPEAAYRFKREAVLLAELHHPAIVSYVAHGTTAEGQPFLVMEWLEGEDLAHRLLRQPLSLSETLSLLRRAAEGLATAHQQGIVHRDLKPSNLFLRGGRPEDVVLLDFGLARTAVPTLMGVTASNTILGTPGYMAPEQASSQPDILASADIFSLGCVLYECLAGKAPFKAPHFAAALAKIMFTEPAPLHTLRTDLPPELQVLVERMLDKEPRRRPPDATILRDALSTIEASPEHSWPRATGRAPPSNPASAEQQLVSVLLVNLPDPGTRPLEPMTQGLQLRDSLRTTLAPYRARVELLANGSLVSTLVPERGTAMDQAALAARCSLTIKEHLPEAVVVLATGLSMLDEHLPVGAAMDKAGRLLRQVEQTPHPAVVVLDEVTAGLLGSSFQLSRSGSDMFLLHGEQLGADPSRPLLGKPTPCVGREQELALLDYTLTSCIEESTARALLVTAPAGVGKSRLRHEFLRRVEHKKQPILVLLGRGDSMSAGAALGLLGQAIRRLCEIVEGESLEARRARLSQRVALHLPAAEARATVEFLGELCAIPFPDEESPRLRAARTDPRLMSVQVGRSLVSFLEAECAHHPVLLVLEDLHWSDALTLKLLDELMRELSEHPFMVLALARPEVREVVPGSWFRRTQELHLNGMSRKAGARLVREVLGPQVPEDFVQRAVEHSDGNALFLEELIRMEAEGRGESAPETVLAVLQARLLRMEPTLRQVLLAASIFGRTFRAGGVRELLGPQGEATRVEQHLRQLVEQEIIESLPTSRLLAESEYRFRHALVRDAAYGLLPDNHRSTSHRLAATWMERTGEPDALVLATHYRLGQWPERAVHFQARAAEQLFERHDLQGTLRCVDEALACGAEGEPLLRLRALQAVVAFWMEQMPRTLEFGRPALAALKPGSRLWCRLMGSLIIATGSTGHMEEAISLSSLLLHTTPEPEAIAVYAEVLSFQGVGLAWMGARQVMEVWLGRLVEMSVGVMSQDAIVRGWVRYMEANFLHYFEGRPGQAARVAELGWRDFREVGSERNALLLQNLSAAALVAMGDLASAEARLRESLGLAQPTEQLRLIGMSRHHLSLALASSTKSAHHQEAALLAREGLEDANGPIYRRGIASAVLAQVAAVRGELREAEADAHQACELLMTFPNLQLFARTVLSNILRLQGRAVEARQEAELGMGSLRQMDSEGVYAVGMRLALAEACFAQGDAPAGEAALREALRCVQERASDLSDPALRERFLGQVPENARTLELARQRWGDLQP